MGVIYRESMGRGGGVCKIKLKNTTIITITTTTKKETDTKLYKKQ